MRRISRLLLAAMCVADIGLGAQVKTLRHLGEADGSASGFALAPDGYKKFLSRDFGYEDRFFFVGQSVENSDFSYVLPGPADGWGGTAGTSGWRTLDATIEIRLDSPQGTLLGTCQVGAMPDEVAYEIHEAQVAKANGVPDFVFVFRSASSTADSDLMNLEWFRFAK